MKIKNLILIFTFLLSNLYAQEISEITLNENQTHFFYLKNRDSLFVKSVNPTSEPIFITDGCNVETNPIFRRWVQNDESILIQKKDGLYLFELKSLQFKKIPLDKEISYFFFYYIQQIASFDDQLFFASKETSDSHFSLYHLNLKTYSLKKIQSVKKRHVSNIAISKDHKLLAYSYFDHATLYAKSGLHILDLQKNKLIYEQQEKDSSFFYGLEFNHRKDLLYRDLVRDNYIIKNSDSIPDLVSYPVDEYGYFIRFLDNETLLSFKQENKIRSYDMVEIKSGHRTSLVQGPNIRIKSIDKKDSIYSIFSTDENGKTPIQLHQMISDINGNLLTQQDIFSPHERNPYKDAHYSIETYENAGNGVSDAYLYLPKSSEYSTSKIPLIIMVYGCYEDRYPSRSYFMDNILLDYVNKGYGVVRLNTRGMCDEYLYDGYGKIQLADTEAFVDYISKKYPIDLDKVVVAGHSHGATMVYYYMTHSNKFAAGLSFNGSSDWVKQAQKKSITGLPQEMGGTPEQLPEKYKDFSPLENIHSAMNPMFIVTGAKDTQIPDNFNSKVFVEKARTLNLPIEYIHFEDEGHLFLQEKNRKKIKEQLEDFLSKVLF